MRTLHWVLGFGAVAVVVGSVVYLTRSETRDPGPIVAADGSGPTDAVSAPANRAPATDTKAQADKSAARENGDAEKAAAVRAFVPTDPNTVWKPTYRAMEALGTPDDPMVRSPDGQVRRL